MFIHARLAQSVERWTLNPTVVGSSPTLGDSFVNFAHGFAYLGVQLVKSFQLLDSWLGWDSIWHTFLSKRNPFKKVYLISTGISTEIIRPSFFQSAIFCHCAKPISDDYEDFDDDVLTESYCDCHIIGTNSCDKLFRKQKVRNLLPETKSKRGNVLTIVISVLHDVKLTQLSLRNNWMKNFQGQHQN